MLIAGGAALCGAVIAAAAGFVVGAPPAVKPIATVEVRAAHPGAASHARPPTGSANTLNSTPWVEVPVEPVLALPSAVAATSLPVARPAPWAKPLARSAPGPAPVDSSSRASSAPPASAIAAAAPAAPSSRALAPKATAQTPVDPVLKAVEDDMRVQQSLAPAR
jgi:hypothetical protein